ncbi:hypothetical protein PMAYCL1PPCAC_29826, partial [Pristionchus mayeri]
MHCLWLLSMLSVTNANFLFHHYYVHPQQGNCACACPPPPPPPPPPPCICPAPQPQLIPVITRYIQAPPSPSTTLRPLPPPPAPVPSPPHYPLPPPSVPPSITYSFNQPATIHVNGDPDQIFKNLKATELHEIKPTMTTIGSNSYNLQPNII